MKKLLTVLLAALLLAGCTQAQPVATVQTTAATTQPAEQFFNRTIVWGAQYVRTDSYIEGAKYPDVLVFDSVETLHTYGKFDRLQEACVGYDEAFFEERYLIMVLVQEPSGSNSHEVLKVEQVDNKTAIYIDRIIPPVGTCDMAQWHIIVDLKRDVPVKTNADVQVYLDDRLAWDGQWVAPPKPDAQYKTPPEIEMRTPMGDTVLKPAGYSWTYENPDGSFVSAIADQTARPIPKEDIQSLTIDAKYAETVYALARPGTHYEPTNCLGFFIKLHCPGNPTSISYVKWTDSGVEEQVLDAMESSFYAEIGSYIYEISVSWEDEQAGYFGSANYYICITGQEGTS